jgi:hypothetical protein
MPTEPASETIWFAALLRVIWLVDDAEQGNLLQDEVVHVFRAPDRDAAFLRALALGRGHEAEYLNDKGAVVQWRFERVVKLQGFSAEGLDGTELSSTLSRTDFVSFETKFEPWAHPPEDDLT